jgi:hypothetical protein
MRSVVRHLAASERSTAAIVFGVLLCTTALAVGFSIDDYTHRSMLDGSIVGIERPWWDLFRFFMPDAVWEREARASGMMPWYAQPGIHVGFFRPLTSLSIVVDHLIWPDSALGGHLHSLVWFAAYLAASMAVFRRLLPAPAAILACWALALDDSHGYLVGWIAQRNATIAATFAMWAFLHHIRWREGEGRHHLAASMLLYALALCGGEIGVEVTPFVASYALFKERGAPLRRLAGLAPMGAITLVWLTFYAALDYGTWGSGLYVDPIAETGRFMVFAMQRVPTLLLAQFTPVGADMSLFLGEERTWWLAAGGIATVAAVTWVTRRAGAGRDVALWTFAMVVSLLPSAGTFPSNRMLVVGGVAGSALVGLIAAAIIDGRFEARASRLIAGLIAANAFLIGPLMLPLAAWQIEVPASVYRCSAASMDAIAPDLDGSSVVVLAAPDIFSTSISVVTRAAWHVDHPDRQWLVHSALGDVTLERPSATALVVSVDRHGAPPVMDRLLRPSSSTFEVGASYGLGDQLTLRIDRLDAGGWPDVVTLSAPAPLESLGYLWATWTDDGYRPVLLPAIGASTWLPTATLQGIFALPFGRQCVARVVAAH